MDFPPDITDPNVLRAMQTVPRYRFVPQHLIDEADGDYPLPIGHGQTISQPYVVAIMSQALAVEPGDKVLEVGTGSGFQAAVLAEMGCKVYSIEIIAELATRASGILDDLGYNVEVTVGDGYHGWPEHSPYQGIVVTAAPDIPPQALLDQLGLGASLIVPVGPAGGLQTLWRLTRKTNDEFERTNLGGVRFVPFTRNQSY